MYSCADALQLDRPLPTPPPTPNPTLQPPKPLFHCRHMRVATSALVATVFFFIFLLYRDSSAEAAALHSMHLDTRAVIHGGFAAASRDFPWRHMLNPRKRLSTLDIYAAVAGWEEPDSQSVSPGADSVAAAATRRSLLHAPAPPARLFFSLYANRTDPKTKITATFLARRLTHVLRPGAETEVDETWSLKRALKGRSSGAGNGTLSALWLEVGTDAPRPVALTLTVRQLGKVIGMRKKKAGVRGKCIDKLRARVQGTWYRGVYTMKYLVSFFQRLTWVRPFICFL
jgi:hypothetical protein